METGRTTNVSGLEKMEHSGPGILVVDDNPTNRKLLVAILETEGYTSHEACDGEDALRLLEEKSVNAIVSDVLMPNMDGYRLCYEVRKSQRHSTLPFIFLTATYTSPADEKLALELGADRMLKKPVSSIEVLQTLSEILTNPRFQEHRVTVQPHTIEVIKEYRDALVIKLEEKIVDLAKRTEELEQEILRRQHSEEEVQRLNEGLEQKVDQRTAELQAANMELKAFAHSVAHDLRNPLTAINAFIYLLVKKHSELLNEDLQRTIHGIEYSCKRMGQIIEDFLLLSGISRKPFQARPLDFSTLAQEVVEGVLARDPDRKMEVSIMPGLEMKADRGLMQIVMENFIGNALKFTRSVPNPRIEIGGFAEDSTDTYFIADNGAGFDMSHAGKLFAPFSRLHTTEEFEGTGIGLSIVQRIILRHGGKVWVDAAVGKGATFFFSLPVANAQRSQVPLREPGSRVEMPSVYVA